MDAGVGGLKDERVPADGTVCDAVTAMDRIVQVGAAVLSVKLQL